jgi:hypothetical protein
MTNFYTYASAKKNKEANGADLADKSTTLAQEEYVQKAEEYTKGTHITGEGWIWSLGGSDGLSKDAGDLEKWQDAGKCVIPSLLSLTLHFTPETSGDRVQWFKAEAEVLRWLEQVELKHCEFVRVIRSLGFTSRAWKAAAGSCSKKGYSAYALRKAALYETLRADAVRAFKAHADPGIMGSKCSSSFEEISYCDFINCIAINRNSLLQGVGIMHGLVSGYSSNITKF